MFKPHLLCSVPQTAVSEISYSCAFLEMTTSQHSSLKLPLEFDAGCAIFFGPIKIPRISSFPFSSIPPTPKHIPAHNDCPQTFGPCKVLPASKRKSLASASAFQSIVKVSRLSDWVCLVVSKLVARHQEALTSSSKVQRGLNPVPWSQRPRRPVRRTNDILGVPNGWGPKKRLLRSKLE